MSWLSSMSCASKNVKLDIGYLRQRTKKIKKSF